MIKWPPDMQLEKSVHFELIDKNLKRYMQYNNFKFEEIQYIYTMLNTFYYLNRPNYDNDTKQDQEASRITQEATRND